MRPIITITDQSVGNVDVCMKVPKKGRIMMINFPQHKAGLYLTHNEHKDYYETVESWMGNFDWGNDWVSPEQRERSLETQECWVLQWYPHTPISSYRIQGADLEVVLKEALEMEKEYDKGNS